MGNAGFCPSAVVSSSPTHEHTTKPETKTKLSMESESSILQPEAYNYILKDVTVWSDKTAFQRTAGQRAA